VRALGAVHTPAMAELRATVPPRDARARRISLLAALSLQTNFSVGCYCDDESVCHRSLLRELLREEGAKLGG
jgi:uncharacterized protein YeaO (DUF488 family)